MSEEIIRRAGNWFTGSGIQEDSGGVARYYCSDTGRNQRVSTEITGYAAGSLAYLYSRTADPRYLDSAVSAARFLTGSAWDRKTAVFPFEHGGEALAYFFDTGIIIRGLLAVWRVTGEEELLDVAAAAGRALYRHFARRDHFHPILQLPDLSPLAWEPQWSRSPGCYQLKAALAWLELAEACHDTQFAAWYEQLLKAGMLHQGNFLTEVEDPNRRMDRLHAYSYFLEGLLPAMERPPIRAALADGLEHAAFHLREIAPQFERSDVPAQLLRVRLLAAAAGAVPLDEPAAADEARRTAAFQLNTASPRHDGGFAFGRLNGQLLPHVNPVSTAFCSQALEFWDRTRRGLALPGWVALI